MLKHVWCLCRDVYIYIYIRLYTYIYIHMNMFDDVIIIYLWIRSG